MIVTEKQLGRLMRELKGFSEAISHDVREINVSVYESVFAGDQKGTIAFTMTHPGIKADHSDWSMLSDNILPDGTSFT